MPEPNGPKDNPHLRFVFEAEGGDVLLDDVEIWMEGDANPTAFRDDCVRMLKTYRPGCIRNLQMGGSTLDNMLAPPLRRHAFASQRSTKVGPYERHSMHDYSLHEMYVLCEHVGANPWFCLPGTLSKSEMVRFMEYLGAPADVGYGMRRAELGHPKPWTDVFDHIHVEFGNEAWNNAGPYQCGGFNGRDYWDDLIAAGKASSHYRPTFLACALANRVMGGRLVETVHSHGEPTFTGRGKFRYRGEVEDYGPLPVLWSYAFRDGDRRSLVVLNIDVAQAHPVAVAFNGKVHGGTAKRWRLVSDSVTANNEFEQPEPQVRLVEDVVEHFAPGRRFTLPPHSAMALEWQAE